jgi:hypothetical protein
MRYNKILILEAPWSGDIEDTRATREIYSSAETLLSIHPKPVQIIQRPLVSTTYLQDIRQFVELPCNQRGPNFVILSAHGAHSLVASGKHRRELLAFDSDLVNISKGIRELRDKLAKTVFILDACEIGDTIESFREAAGALGAIGFANNVNWIDSSIFVLALLLRFQEQEVYHSRTARRVTETTEPEVKRVVKEMIEGTYKSLALSLGVEHSFRK